MSSILCLFYRALTDDLNFLANVSIEKSMGVMLIIALKIIASTGRLVIE